MKNILSITVIISVFFAFIGCEKIQAQNVGEAAPDFSLETLKGTTFTLSEHRGKVVFIFLFGNNCPHCIANAPNTENSIYQVFKDNDKFEAIGIDTWNGSKSSVQAFVNRTNLTYPVCVDGSTVQSAYNTTYDRILIVDEEGILRFKATANATSGVTAEAATVIEDLLKSLTTGIESTEISKNNISVYPNPISDFATIQTGFDPGSMTQISLLDNSGRNVMDQTSLIDQAGKIRIDFNNYASGMYYLRLRSGEEVDESRIIIRGK